MTLEENKARTIRAIFFQDTSLKKYTINGMMTIKGMEDFLLKIESKINIVATKSRNNCFVSMYFIVWMVASKANKRLRISSLFLRLFTTSVCIGCAKNNSVIRKLNTSYPLPKSTCKS